MYRRPNDDKGDYRNEAEVDDEAVVEVGEVAEGRHLAAIGVHQRRPEGKVLRRGQWIRKELTCSEA